MSKTTLTRNEISQLGRALMNELAGRVEVAKDGDGKTLGLILVPYDFTGKAIYATALSLNAIRGEVDAINLRIKREREAAKIKDNEPLPAELEGELLKFLSETVEVELTKTGIEGIKVEKNKLDPRVVAALMPMLDGEI